MTRPSTLVKEKVIIKEFHRLLRSGKDYSTNSMYEESGQKCYVSGITAGAIIRRDYRKQITDEMRETVEMNNTSDFDALLRLFCCKFSVCKREGRLILGYIR